MKLVAGMALPDDDSHFATYAHRGRYQADNFEAALPYVKRHDLAVDVGAHVGFWSREMVQHFARVVAFEPIEANRECFSHNLHGHGSVELFPVALGARPGAIGLKKSDPENSGTWERRDGAKYRVETLDSYTLTGIGLIKIDVQGMEIEVLHGAEKTIRADRPVVVLEVVMGGKVDERPLKLLRKWGARRVWADGKDRVMVFD